MTTREPVRVPWERIALALGLAVLVAWTVGFIAGLVVRLSVGWRS